MYTPPAFRDDDRASIHALIEAAGLATLVTMTEEGLVGTPLPLFLVADEGPLGTLYGHVARANPQWRLPPVGEALAIFAGPDAYVSPGLVRGQGRARPGGADVELRRRPRLRGGGVLRGPGRLRAVVARLTDRHEAGRAEPWSVDDAPEAFVQAQLRGIVGVRHAGRPARGQGASSARTAAPPTARASSAASAPRASRPRGPSPIVSRSATA